MIRRLRRRFVLLCGGSVLAVFTGIFLLLAVFGHVQTDRAMDTLTDAIARGGGIFPEWDALEQPPERFSPFRSIINEETRFSVRFFTVWTDADGAITRVNMDSVASVAEPEIEDYARQALEEGSARGWVGDYRYLAGDDSGGTMLVFVNGSMNRAVTNRLLATAFLVLLGSGSLILLLSVVISRYAVRPVAESYERQKQFITDANHELKTPLTLILSNLDIVESELGKNEWLDDIRSEGERMGQLISQLVTLSRLDEDQPRAEAEDFGFSEALSDVVSEFQGLAASRGVELVSVVEPGLVCRGDEGLIRRLAALLLDNAVKYCDPGGRITVTALRRHSLILTVENTFAGVDQLELSRLFDRFYRADRARTYSGSFGVGLSIAQSIVRLHHGSITAYKRPGLIGFRAELR